MSRIDLDGTDPATILLRRTKQNMAEYFRLQLKRSMWRGMRAHAEQGYNLGKVLDGYLPERIPHPAPAKAAQGRTKPSSPWTRSAPPSSPPSTRCARKTNWACRPSTPG